MMEPKPFTTPYKKRRINVDWLYQVPPFIGNDYCCETGRHSTDGSCHNGSNNYYFPDDPLWEGQNFAPSSKCSTTSDDLEIGTIGILQTLKTH